MNEAPSEPEPQVSLVGGGMVYGLLLAAGLVWLSLRDRGSQLATMAIGERGPWVGSAVGLAVGVAFAFAFGMVSRRSKGLQGIEAQVRTLFARVGDMAAMAFLLVGAIAEEVFFRLAVQDAIGLFGSVATYVLVNSSIAGLRMVPFTALHALVLGLLVQQGFGLLASTTAHAIMNYLSLRRILCT